MTSVTGPTYNSTKTLLCPAKTLGIANFAAEVVVVVVKLYVIVCKNNYCSISPVC